MYIGVDIGGTKTLIASIDESGKIVKSQKYQTIKDFADFAKDLVEHIRTDFMTDEIKAIAVGAPGQIDYDSGDGVVFGNLNWHNVPIGKALETAFGLPVTVENDANTAGLAEARSLTKPASSVVYVTVSTGIGTGIITDNRIDPHWRHSEGGQMLFEYKGQLVTWESFASGRALFERYNTYAKDLEDEQSWREVAYNIALGLSNIAALLAPEVAIIGGSIGQYLPKYESYLHESLDKLKVKMINIPLIVQAQHPEEAVVYGCYHLAKDLLNG
jgi:predicted NBD/HSP70 family sugar kinase